MSLKDAIEKQKIENQKREEEKRQAAKARSDYYKKELKETVNYVRDQNVLRLCV